MSYDLNITLSATNILIKGDGYTDGFSGSDIRGVKATTTTPGPSGTLPIWLLTLDLTVGDPYVIELRYVVTPSTWNRGKVGADQAVADVEAIIATCCSGGGGGGGAAWGGITGTLSSQTDLNTALGDKLSSSANLSDVGSASTSRTNLGLGTAALNNTGDFATPAQGTKADSAVQTVVAGTNVTVDNTSPQNPIVSAVISPAGTDRQLQYNNAGALEGVAGVVVTPNGNLRILPPVVDPPSAPTTGFTLFDRTIAGRSMPAFIGPSGLDAAMQPFLGRQKIAWAQANGGSTVLSVMGIAITATGTATLASSTSTNFTSSTRRLNYLVTTASTNAVAGWRSAITQFWLGNSAGLGGFTYITRFCMASGTSTTTTRCFVGMRNITAVPTDVNPSTLVNMFGIGWDDTDTNMQFFYNGASGTASKIDLGSSFPRPTGVNQTVYEAAFFSAPNSGAVYYQLMDLVTGAIATGNVSTNLPSNTTFLAPLAYNSVGGTNNVIGIGLLSIYIETDN